MGPKIEKIIKNELLRCIVHRSNENPKQIKQTLELIKVQKHN